MKLSRLVLAALLLGLPMQAEAEDLNAIFKRVNDLIAAKNYPKALEELGWARKEIEKLHVTNLQSFLPDSLAGFTGAKFESAGALGMMNLERSYSSGEKQLEVSVTGGAGSAEGFGNIAAIGRMAAMMRGGMGQDTFRVQGRTAQLNTSSEDPEMTVFLDSGSMLMLRGSGGTTGEELKKAAEALSIEKLDSYLRGSAQG